MQRETFITRWAAVASLAVATALASPCLAMRGRPHAASPQHRAPAPAPQRHESAPPARREPPARPQGQNHVGDWLRQHKDLSPAEQERALQNEPGFRKLTPERQQQLRERLRHFSSLPPAQQQRILNNMDRWAHLTPQQKQQARQVFGQMQQLSPDRRRMVNTAIGDLRGMPAVEREQIIDSPRFKGMFSPQEREIMRGASKLPLAPPEKGDGSPNE
jgi:hypothetical protein